MISRYGFLVLFLLGCQSRQSDKADAISDRVRAHFQFPAVEDLPLQPSIPNLFMTASGDTVQNLAQWQKHRAYIKKMLSYYQYGEMPPKPDDFEVTITSEEAGKGRVNGSYEFTIIRNGKSLTLRLGLIRPDNEGAYPVIIKNDRYRFDLSEIENEAVRKKYTKQNRAAIDEFVADEALKRGYVYCKFIREDIARDVNGARNGRIFELYPDYEWGAITAWAWAYQLIIDWLEQQTFADTAKIIATGHSRGGKTALCAGIFEERIAVTAPNSSGIGGTASFRFFDPDQPMQTIAHHKERFSHWWPTRWYTLADNVQKVPFDAHFAKALIAPRKLLNTHARHDYWANPYGTYLTFLKSRPAFDLYGASHHNAIHWRDGGHAQGEEDWLALFDYCDWIFFQKPTARQFNLNPHPSTYQFDSLARHDITNIHHTRATEN